MSESQSKKNQSHSKKQSKKSYQSPKVTVYGSVSKLTGAKAVGKKRDGSGTKKT